MLSHRKFLVTTFFTTELVILCLLPCAQASLVSYWSMNDNLTDSIGGHDGTYMYGGVANNAYAWYEAGVVGNCLYIDGDGSFVEIADEAAFDSTSTALTVSCWVKTDGGLSDDWMNLINKGCDDGWELRNIWGETDQTCLTVHLAGQPWGINENNYSTPNVYDDQWHHVAATFDGVYRKLYVDGSLVDRYTLGTEASPVQIQSTDEPVRFGAYYTSTVTDTRDYFRGWMDEVAIYDSALTSNQVTALYNTVSPDNLPAAIPDNNDPVTVTTEGEYVGLDTTTGAWWRDSSVSKATDADNVYGTDGYVFFGYNVLGSVPNAEANHLYDLPDYINSVESFAAHDWTGSATTTADGNKGQIEDPLNPGTLRSAVHDYGFGSCDYLITRATDEAFCLTLMMDSCVDAIEQSQMQIEIYDATELGNIGVEVEPIAVWHDVPFGANNDQTTYQSFAIPAGTNDIIVRLSNCIGDNPGMTGIAFDPVFIEEEWIPGDANKDGKVDGSDVTILAGNWQVGVSDGQTANWGMGDFNGDGKVDGSDVTILAGNWQSGVTTSAASVPEPSTLILLLGMVFMFCKRRPQK